MNGKNFLVTGGAGFIGSHFVKLLFEKHPGCKVRVLDKLTYCGRLENLKEVEGNKNYEFVKGDICGREEVSKAMQGIDVVVNFAAETHVDRAIKNASAFIKTDVFGTFTLLEEARKQNMERFVQISTDEVYGQIKEGSFKETAPLNPRNPYSASKASADRLAYSYFATYGLPVVIARSANNFGPNQFPEKIIPLFVTNLLRGKKVPLYGEGKQVRDWLYVKDNCKAIELLSRKGKNGEAYNVGGKNEVENIALTGMILEELGKGEEMIEFVEDRLGHDFRYSLDCEKIRELGWKPETGFREGLKETISWYKENEWWWKALVK